MSRGMSRVGTVTTLALVTGYALSATAQDPPPAPQDIRQVQIQVFIAQTDEDGQRSLGTNLNYTRFTRAGRTHPGIEHSGSLERVSTKTFTPTSREFQATLPAPDNDAYEDASRIVIDGGNIRRTTESATPWTPANQYVQVPALAGAVPAFQPNEYNVNTQGGAGLSFEVLDADRGTIEGVLRSIETRTDSDLISKPELVVIQGQQAGIKAGEEVPWQNVAYKNGNPQLSIAWEQVGVDVSLTPTIASDDLVQLEITRLSVVDRLADKTFGNLQIPVFTTREQQGTVLVPNAQSLVIGGLQSRIEKRAEKRVPVVGRIPLFGIMFRGRDTDARYSQLYIFISPTIVDLRDYSDEMDNAMTFWREDAWESGDSIQQEMDYTREGL